MPTTAAFADTEIKTSGGSLRVLRQGEGPPLLFVVGGKPEFWSAQLRAFSHDHEVIAFERLGPDKDGPYSGPFSEELLAQDACDLLDHLQIERIDMAGHSMGASVVQRLAIFHPERVGRIVLSGAWAGPSPLFSALFELRREVLVRCGPEAYQLLGAVLSSPLWWLEPQFESRAAFVADRMKSFAGIEVELGRIATVSGHDLRDHAPRIAAPTLVVWTRDDQIVPPSLSSELVRLIPGARGCELPEGGHFAPVTAAEAYNEALRAFLTPELPPSKRAPGAGRRLRRSW